MGNKLENKAKFFALYYGQVVAKITKGSYTHPLDTVHVVDKNVLSSVESEKYVKHKYSLELKNLSLISENDAKKYEEITGQQFTSAEFAFCIYQHSIIGVIAAIDYLRGRGYYVGNGSELEYGWVRLKGDPKP